MKGRLLLLCAGVLAALLLVVSLPQPPLPVASAAGLQPLGPASAQVGAFDRLPEGRLLFAKDGNLWLWERGTARQLTQGGTWMQPQWSPDGKRIAYVYRGPQFSDAYLMSAAGGDYVRLTRSQSSVLEENDWVFRPTWSPDGARLAYVTDTASANPNLWLMNVDGSGKRPIAPALGAVDAISWSPDGTQIAATGFTGPVGQQNGQVFLLDLRRGITTVLTDLQDGALDPGWSPDGKWITYVGRDARRTTLHAMKPDGTGSSHIADQSPVRSPTWSPNGRHLAFLRVQSSGFELWVMDVEPAADRLRVSNPRQLTRDLGIDALSGLSWTR